MAVLDVGTNTVLLTVAEITGGRAVPLGERAIITRLGEGVDEHGVLSTIAVERTLAALAELAEVARELGATRTIAVATSAMRDARGGERFLDRAKLVLGTRPRVISGELEAALTFEGSVSGLALDGELFVFDIGGGSTELAAGRSSPEGPRLGWARSLELGSVRLFERHMRHDPSLAPELAACRAALRTALAPLERPAAGAHLVGVAGTMTTLAALARGEREHVPGRLHGARLDAASVSRLAEQLARMSLAERRALPALEPGRADVIAVGAALADEVLSWAGAAVVTVSDRGVRWGLLLRLARGEAPDSLFPS